MAKPLRDLRNATPGYTLLLCVDLLTGRHDGSETIFVPLVLGPLRQTSCRLPFHADDPRRSDPTCKRFNIHQSS